jgi:hypothetical protein
MPRFVDEPMAQLHGCAKPLFEMTPFSITPGQAGTSGVSKEAKEAVIKLAHLGQPARQVCPRALTSFVMPVKSGPRGCGRLQVNKREKEPAHG